jgi:V8-like Glu-specific endopeptidase
MLAVTISGGGAILSACAQGSNAGPSCNQTSSNAIVGGKAASAYPEAVLVDMKGGAACSGSLIAPSVVLTAGHCVDGFDSWGIQAPFAGNQSSSSSDGETYDWAENGAETVNPDHHDIGLVYLQTPLRISHYPTLSQKALADGTEIVNVGRIQDGQLSKTSLFVSSPAQLTDGTASGYPLDYTSDAIIQPGDSGGPVFLASAAQHTIVAVNSGVNPTFEVLARVDLLYSWIAQKVQAHGGFTQPDAAADAGSGSHRDAGLPAREPSADEGDPGDTPAGAPSNSGPSKRHNPCSQ